MSTPAPPDTSRLPYRAEGYSYLWFPQVGGYCSPCAIRPTTTDDSDPCFEIWIWHDGEFPCNDPAHFHLCSTIVRDLSKLVREFASLASAAKVDR